MSMRHLIRLFALAACLLWGSAQAQVTAHGEVGVGGGRESHGPNVSCQPTLGYMGQDRFTYTATTANGTSAPATVRIEIFER